MDVQDHGLSQNSIRESLSSNIAIGIEAQNPYLSKAFSPDSCSFSRVYHRHGRWLFCITDGLMLHLGGFKLGTSPYLMGDI